jgi:hypothetical protein
MGSSYPVGAFIRNFNKIRGSTANKPIIGITLAGRSVRRSGSKLINLKRHKSGYNG